MSEEKLKRLKEAVIKKWGESTSPFYASSAPGRVNLIGEHTDYNDGFVLPSAVNLRTYAVGRRRADDRVKIWSANVGEEVEFSLKELEPPGKALWWTYMLGPAYVLLRRGFEISGFEIAVEGEVPLGGGLSSSASVETAVTAVLQSMFDLPLERKEIALISREAENTFAGVPCGVMDQMASVFGEKNSAVFLDCRSLEMEHVKIPESWSIIVCDTGVRHELGSSEYPKRQAECREAVNAVKKRHPHVRALRDVSLEMLEEARGEMSDVAYRRARYVIEENRRVLEAKRALREGDREKVFVLFRDSHQGLRFEYEVSCRELDVLAELAWKAPGVVGARMTGGGFGGNTVNFVEKGSEKDFAEYVSRGYERETGRKPEIRVLSADEGVRVWKEI